MTDRRVMLAAGLGLAVLATACHQDELFTAPVPTYAGGALFQRYVAVGDNITAGFQSGGINDSLQRQSYAVKVAAAMGGATFYRPSLASPGCPPPIDTLFRPSGTPHRLGGGTDSTCAFRDATIPPYITNVAVPGATVLDAYQSGETPTANPLTQLILGGRSQIQALGAARPTFVSIAIGNNDVLYAARDTVNAGNPALITDTATFRTRYDAMLAALDDNAVQGGILIGVADPTGLPYFSYGQVYFAAFGAGQQPNFTVLPNCAPQPAGIGDTVLVPFPYGFALIGAAQAGLPTTLDCTDDHNIQPGELADLHATVVGYNAVISARATARNWAYVDPNLVLAALRADPAQVAPFPNTSATSCSSVGAAGSPFGLAFSCDGLSPSTATHRLIAHRIVQVINAKYGSAIPAVP